MARDAVPAVVPVAAIASSAVNQMRTRLQALALLDRAMSAMTDAELADPQPLRLQPHVQVEQHRVVRQLEPLGVEVVLGEADRVVTELVGELALLEDLAQHRVVEVATQPGVAGLDVSSRAAARQVEERRPHRE